MVWTEELDDWSEARNIDELKRIFKKTPPPIPKKSEKIYKVEAEIKKKKLIKQKAEIVTAREIKTNFKMIIFAVIIGFVSYPIWFAIEDGFAHQNMYKKWKQAFAGPSFDFDNATEEASEKRHEIYQTLKRKSRRLGLRGFKLPLIFHKDKYKDATEYAIQSSIITAIIASIVLILGRYLIRGAKWVEDTSKKEL